MYEAAIAAAAANDPQKPIVAARVPGLQLNIDGDYLAYYASGNDDTTPGQARENALNLISRYAGLVGADSIVMHNTANGCQKGERYLIATVKPYQGQRAGGHKPKNHAYLQEWLQSYEGPAFLVKNWTTREADDGMAACAHFAVGNPKGPGYAAIATADKDLRMLPGLHINWRNGGLTRVMPGDYDVIGKDGKQYGLKFFFLQMLMGDAADNCPGLETMKLTNPDGTFKRHAKVGEKTAAELLAACTTTEEACRRVIELYAEGYSHMDAYRGPPIRGMDRFCEQAALMWMRLGNNAAITDFAHHNGCSRINHAFTDEVWAAVERLEQRVQIARSTINSFGSSDGTLSTDRLAA